MVGICFYFEDHDIDVWSGRRIDLDAWNYAIKAAGDIDEVCIINTTNMRIEGPDTTLKTTIVKTLPQLPGKVANICCPWDTAKTKVSLWDFDHNIDWYVFGPALGWQQSTINVGVYIPVATQRIALHAIHIASTVLLHRYHKRNSN